MINFGKIGYTAHFPARQGNMKTVPSTMSQWKGEASMHNKPFDG